RVATMEQPDIIHSHLLKADRVASAVKAAATIPLRHIMTVHGDYGAYISQQADPRILHFNRHVGDIIEGADAVVAICRDQMRFLPLQFPRTREKLRFIYNGYL